MSVKRIGIADIAREARLSRATVDRVLNGRDGVRPDTVRRVEEAVGRLQGTGSAYNLRPGRARRSVEILLSEGGNPFFAQLRAGFAGARDRLGQAGHGCVLGGFDPYDPPSVVARLEAVAPETDAVITVGVDTPEVRFAIDDLAARGVRVVTVVSDVPGSRRAAHVGQDNFAAGRTAARLMLGALPDGPCRVAVLVGHLRFRHLLDRQSGFQQVLGLERPDAGLALPRPYGTDPGLAGSIVEELVGMGDDLQGVYIAGGGQAHLLDRLAERLAPRPGGGPAMICHEATAETRRRLLDGTFRFVLAHDVPRMASLALEALFDDGRAGTIDAAINIHVKENFPELL